MICLNVEIKTVRSFEESGEKIIRQNSVLSQKTWVLTSIVFCTGIYKLIRCTSRMQNCSMQTNMTRVTCAYAVWRTTQKVAYFGIREDKNFFSFQTDFLLKWQISYRYICIACPHVYSRDSKRAKYTNSLSLSLYIYIYIYIYVCVCVCVCVCNRRSELVTN